MSLYKLRASDLSTKLRGKQIGKLTKADRDEINNLLLVKDIIRDGFKKQAKIAQSIIDQKRALGYCGGFQYCTNYTGDNFMCAECRWQKDHPRFHRKQSEYGKLREIEKKQAKKI